MNMGELLSFRLDPDRMEALRAIKVRDGVPISEQVRRAIDLWLAQKGLGKTPGARKGRPRAK